ncbi:hypothetical protein KC318_g45 [Hortaea werneckii]|nr:hypothetical protein KC334_g42 [Hortaea werneckii]KAI7676773.1 hypothetical protein KC318_g45 [Hortaea werneckii]
MYILRPIHFLHSLTNTAMLRSHTNILNIAKASDTEELVHPLERDAFRLRHEEPRNDHHTSAEAAEDEIGTVAVRADCLEHDRDSASDDEVEEPGSKLVPDSIAKSGFRHTIESNIRDPSRTGKQPRRGKQQRGRQAEVEHHDCHHGSGPDEGQFAAESVDEEDEEEEAGDHLDDAVDARGEEGVGVAGDAEVGEDLGCLFGIGISIIGLDEVFSDYVLHSS